LFYGVTFGGFVGFASFLSILLGDQYGLTKVHAGELAALGVMSGSLVRPLGGLLADRFGGIRMLNVIFGVVALLAMGVAQLPALAVVALIVLAVVQSEWVGVWIDKHGRVQLRPAVAPILDTPTV